MLRWIRGKRLDLKTTIVLLILALAFWAVATWARVKGFIPAELRSPRDTVARIG